MHLQDPSCEDSYIVRLPNADAPRSSGAPFVFCLGRVGDTVLMAPALAWLKEQYGVPCNIITRRSSHAIGPIYDGTDLVKDIYWLREHHLPLFLSPFKLHCVRWLMKQEKSHVYFLTMPDASLMSGVLPVFRRAGFEDDRLIVRTSSSGPRHEARSILDTVMGHPSERVLDEHLSRHVKPGLIDVTADQERDGARILQQLGIADVPFVMVQMGNRKTMDAFRSARRASNKKYWPDENWVATIDGLLQAKPSLNVLLCGAKNEWAYLEETRRTLRSERVINLASQLPLGALKELSTRAHALVSVDTGTAHLAAMLGCPAVVLFGPADPRVYAPLSIGNPVHCLAEYDGQTAYAQNRPDIRLIAPDDVLRMTVPLLDDCRNLSYLLPSRSGAASVFSNTRWPLRRAA